MPIDAIFLDAGGTLLGERSTRAGIYTSVAIEWGLSCTEPQMAGLMSRAHAELPRTFLRTEGPAFRYSRAWFDCFIERIFVKEMGLEPSNCPDVQAALWSRFADPQAFYLVDGALEALIEWRLAGLHVGLISNWSEALPDLLSALLQQASQNPEELLNPMLVSAVEELEKPDPRLFERALARASVSAERSLHLGDHPHNDFHAARAVGMQSALFAPTQGPTTNSSVTSDNHSELTPRFSCFSDFAAWIRTQTN